jgi:thioredoxin 1
MATTPITSDTFDSVVSRPGIVLIDWWAEWCAPCRRFAPIYEAVSERHPDVLFAKIDTQAEPALARSYEIRAIPTLMAIRDGIVVFSQSGMMPDSMLERLIAEVKKLDMDELKQKSAGQSS